MCVTVDERTRKVSEGRGDHDKGADLILISSPLRGTLESLDSKVSTHALDAGVVGVLQVLGGDTVPMLRVANTITVNANIQRLANPTRRNTSLVTLDTS